MPWGLQCETRHLFIYFFFRGVAQKTVSTVVRGKQGYILILFEFERYVNRQACRRQKQNTTNSKTSHKMNKFSFYAKQRVNSIRLKKRNVEKQNPVNLA